MRILLSGGGTGGHVYPVLAVVEALNAQMTTGAARRHDLAAAGHGDEARPAHASFASDRPAGDGAVEFRYLGEAGGIEEMLAGRSGIPFDAISTGQLRGVAPQAAARNLRRMLRGARECAAVIRSFRPDAVFMTGGYVAAPVAWAAWRARPRVPLLIYLPDLTPGRAIQLTSRLAARVAVSFPEVARYFPGKAVVTGYPVRPELLRADRAAARGRLGLAPDLPLVLAFGGSRGARSINRAVVEALPALLPHCQVMHVTGQLDWPWVEDRLAEGLGVPAELAGRYHARAYAHDMVDALAAADIAVARAGAAVLGEFPAAGLAGILVPYPHAGQHQDANATYLAQRGAARIVRDERLGDELAPALLELLGDPERMARMAQAARSLARPDAAANIASELRRLAAANG